MMDIRCLSNLFLGQNHLSIHIHVIKYFDVTNLWLVLTDPYNEFYLIRKTLILTHSGIIYDYVI